MYGHTHTLRFNDHFSRWTWVSQLPPLILLLHLFLDRASFWDRPKLSMSFLTQSNQVLFMRHLCLIPSTSDVIQRLTQSLSSFCSTCPNHINLLFLIIKLTGSNAKSSLSSSLYFLSFRLTPHIHLIILISVRFIFNSCSTFIGQVSLPCIRQLFTQVAYTLPFSFNVTKGIQPKLLPCTTEVQLYMSVRHSSLGQWGSTGKGKVHPILH